MTEFGSCGWSGGFSVSGGRSVLETGRDGFIWAPPARHLSFSSCCCVRRWCPWLGGQLCVQWQLWCPVAQLSDVHRPLVEGLLADLILDGLRVHHEHDAAPISGGVVVPVHELGGRVLDDEAEGAVAVFSDFGAGAVAAHHRRRCVDRESSRGCSDADVGARAAGAAVTMALWSAA